jgi:DNA-binding beta-propeller fold protein YncE
MKRVTLLFLCLALLLPLFARGEEAYASYTTNAWGEAVPAPASYRVRSVLTGEMMGAGRLNKPQDLFYDAARDEVYLADTGNSRVVVLDSSLSFLREYTSAGDKPFVTPSGVFVRADGLIYVADEGAGAVLCLEPRGALVREYTRPVSDLYEEDMPYRPQKVVVDSAGRVYVLSAGVYQGLLCFYEDGSFLNYYGASHVEVTAKVLLQKLWRSFMTRDQREATESFVPIEYANITMDGEDMIYAVVTVSETAGARAMVKLNPMGINILPPVGFSAQAALVDALSEQNNLYTVLDRTSRRVIQFGTDIRGELLSFGGFGDQDGLFRAPVSMERLGEDILVLDSETGAVSRFELTAFGRAIHEASDLYGQGLYEQAIAPWREVLRLSNNFVLAYRGLGKAYYQLEQYEQAMAAFRLANDKQGYSDAFREHSLLRIRANMGWILLGILLLYAGAKLYGKFRRRPALEVRRARGLRPARLPVTLMFHPYEGFDEVKSQGRGSAAVGAGLVGLLFLTAVISFVGTGFIFNHNRLERLNIFLLLGVTLGGFLLFFIANLAVCSLMNDCEGKTRELFIVTSHALLPAILARLAVVVVSNFVNLQMGVFLNMLSTVGVMWSVILLFMGQMQVNRISVKRTLLNLLLSVLVLVIIVVLLVLLYSLYQQINVFFTTLYNEIMFRI